MWWLLRVAHNAAREIRQNTDLAQRLELAMRHSGMGMFEHINGAENAHYDAGMIAIYQLDHQPGMVPVADWLERVHPDDKPQLLQALRQTWSSEKIYDQVDFRAIRPNGEVRHVRAQWVTEMDATGKPVRFIGTHADLTEIRNAEQQRLVATNQLASIAENLPGAMVSFDAKGAQLGLPTFVSRGCADIWGYSQEEASANPSLLSSALAPEHRQELDDLLIDCVTSGKTITHRHQITHRDGRRRWLDLHGSATPISKGKKRLDVIVLDVTYEVEHEQARAETDSRLAYILAHLKGAANSYTIPAGHEMPGPDDKIQFFNRDACFRIFGIEADEAEADAMKLWSLIRDKDTVDEMMLSLAKATRNLEQWHAIMPIVTPQGKHLWIELRSQPNRRDDGSTQYFSLILDVTEQVEREQELEHQKELNHRAQKQQSIGQLTGGVAHDFNNLLAVIMGNLELLRLDENDPDKIQKIDAGIGATRRGADLTSSMLAFAKEARLEPRPVNLNELVRETRNWAGRALPETIEIETSLLGGLWTIEADPASTEAALLNLILNARDAMPDGGKLTIETANIRIDQSYMDSRTVEVPSGRYTMLAVSDTGCGISGELMARIFEPFYTTKGLDAGSGLGLSMVQGFVEQSGGTVQVYSEPGKGTTFKLYFPAVKTTAREIAASEPPALSPPSGTHRVLLVEDEEAVRTVLATMLEMEGYRVSQAMNGDEALAIFKADPGFNLLVTDIVMPGSLQGPGLSKSLRALKPELPVVFISGYASEATVHGNGLRPEDVRLMKPVQRRDFLAGVSQALSTLG
ncbi:PAS domain-containing protein [Rhodobacteraceae bacterium D3-12]|nr:PAS domain-containing protein [Rhodobacteraceae bacterium D3-12]